MSRTNRKHTRAIERHRRNKGPELLSRAADNELKTNADKLAASLSKATMEHGSAAAASLLVDLAEIATYNDNPGAMQRAFSIIDQWEKEPQVVALDTSPQIAAMPSHLLLADGSAPAQAEAPEAGVSVADGASAPEADSTPVTETALSERLADSDVMEGEYVMAPGDPPAKSKRLEGRQNRPSGVKAQAF